MGSDPEGLGSTVRIGLSSRRHFEKGGDDLGHGSGCHRPQGQAPTQADQTLFSN